MQFGDQFRSVNATREGIRRYVLDNGESFKLAKSEKAVLYCMQRAGLWVWYLGIQI
jgi:hypothetical protein